MPPQDLTTILNKKQLKALRKGYSLDAMAAGARYALADARFPPARPLIDALYDRFYPTKDSPLFFDGVEVVDKGRPLPLELNNATRELVLVGILAANGQTFQLVVHMYWALMCGASVEAIANTLLLSANYTGAPVWANGVSSFQVLLELLARLVEEGKTSSAQVMGALQLTFGTGNVLVTPPAPASAPPAEGGKGKG